MTIETTAPVASASSTGSVPFDSERRVESGTDPVRSGVGGVSVLKSGQTSFLNGRILVWFSCGAASACAAKLALARYQRVEVINCDTLPDEHSDNGRFMRDVERWLGVPIKQLRSKQYATVDQVAAGTGYMSGPDGARCTLELKKRPREAYQWQEDLHVWGYTAEEQGRIEDFEWNNPELKCEWVLRDAGMTKADCHAMIAAAGIEQAKMYRLGYEHNNCIGCLKATSPKYWNQIRRDFPETFALRARRSRELGVRLTRVKGVRIFLDQLPENENEEVKEDLSCGPACNPRSVGRAAAAEGVLELPLDGTTEKALNDQAERP